MTMPLFAVTLFDFNLSPNMIAVIVPVAAMLFGGIMAITSMYFRHQQKRLWHETARLTLEKGQPLPAALAAEERPALRSPRHRERNDLRTGLILIAVSGGLWVFLRSVGARDAAAIAAIPGFIGIALILFGIVSAFTGQKSTNPVDHPRQP
jgi:hypothetical protein